LQKNAKTLYLSAHVTAYIQPILSLQEGFLKNQMETEAGQVKTKEERSNGMALLFTQGNKFFKRGVEGAKVGEGDFYSFSSRFFFSPVFFHI
jgi:hypothetical protein